MTVQIIPIPTLHDNYTWLITQKNHSECILVDPGEALPIIRQLEKQKLNVSTILLTHHHNDHIAGVPGLRDLFPSVKVMGPAEENISSVTHPVKEGDDYTFFQGVLSLTAYQVPGHTLGHLVYYGFNRKTPILFSGDTLFSGGCGRCIEGTLSQLYDSLLRLKQLPSNTQLYCGHEYTVKNLQFAQFLEKDNQTIQRALTWAISARHLNQATLPSTLDIESLINPFLRCDQADFFKKLKVHFPHLPQSPFEVFSMLRQAKDQW